jgi:hypothetical protein
MLGLLGGLSFSLFLIAWGQRDPYLMPWIWRFLALGVGAIVVTGNARGLSTCALCLYPLGRQAIGQREVRAVVGPGIFLGLGLCLFAWLLITGRPAAGFAAIVSALLIFPATSICRGHSGWFRLLAASLTVGLAVGGFLIAWQMAPAASLGDLDTETIGSRVFYFFVATVIARRVLSRCQLEKKS